MLSLDLERLHERARQLGRISRAAEQAARHLPEGARGERRQPPGPPPLQGAPRHSEPLLELRRSRGSRAVAQGARQDDHRAQVDLATEESHRGWGHPLSAARRSTAEAPPAPVLLAQVAWPTAVRTALPAPKTCGTLEPPSCPQTEGTPLSAPR